MPDSQLGATYQIDVQCYNCHEKAYNMSIEKGVLLTETSCNYCGCKRLHKIEQHLTATGIVNEQRNRSGWYMTGSPNNDTATIRPSGAGTVTREMNERLLDEIIAEGITPVRTSGGENIPTSVFTPGQVSTLTIEDAVRPD